MIDTMQETIEQLRAENAALKDRCGRCDSKGTVENTIYCADCLEWYREEYATHCPDESAELLNEAHALNRRQAARITTMEEEIARLRETVAWRDTQIQQLQADSTAELLKHRDQMMKRGVRCDELMEFVAARDARIAALERLQSAHLSELDDYGRTAAKLNRRVEELQRRVRAYEEDMNPQDIADISAALAKGARCECGCNYPDHFANGVTR